jgi:hypothetical protein
MKHEAAIVGVGATPYYFRGESAPQTRYELIATAILAATEDAGLTTQAVGERSQRAHLPHRRARVRELYRHDADMNW